MLVDRFFARRDAHAWLDGDGFLVDPEENRGRSMFGGTAAKPWSAFADLPCVVLVGPPGMGKTEELGRIRQRIPLGDAALEVNLREMWSESALASRVLNSREVERWLQCEQVLHLIVDSLDEALSAGAMSPGYPGVLLHELLARDGADPARLRVRLACRTADATQRVVDAFPKALPEEVAVLELLPLRRRDVHALLDDASQEHSPFWAAVDDLSAWPWASTPLTLRFLMGQLRDGRRPESAVELYEGACCEAAAEWDGDRVRGDLGPEGRMRVAARLAAAMLLSGRSALDHSETQAQLGDLDVWTRSACRQGDEPVDANGLRETLATRLFSSLPRRRYRFAHQTYAEFLAAWYLHQRALRLEQLKDLLASDAAGETRVVRELRSVSAWLAMMSDGWFGWVLDHDPHSLLAVGAALPEDRAGRLADRVFEETVRGSVLDGSDVRSYRPLRHTGLADKLRRHIGSGSAGRQARLMAIQAAGDCGVEELASELARIATSAPSDGMIRRYAAASVAAMSEKTRMLLTPLLRENWGDTEADEAKAEALAGTWDALPVGVQFGALGYYTHRAPDARGFTRIIPFVLSRLVRDRAIPELGPGHAIPGLAWLRAIPTDAELEGDYADLAVAVVADAIRHRDCPGVLPALACTLLHAAKGHDWHTWNRAVSEADPSWLDRASGRREFLLRLVRRKESRDTTRLRGLRLWLPSLRNPDDFGWCLERARRARRCETKRFWAVWADVVWDRDSGEHWAAALEARERGGVFAEELTGFHVHIDTARALDPRHRAPGGLRPTTEVRVEERARAAVSAAELVLAGNMGSWPETVRLLGGEGAGRRRLCDEGLSSAAGWASLDDDDRVLVMMAALSFVRGWDPEFSRWASAGRIAPWWSCGYCALVTLGRLTPEAIDAVADDTFWARWAPVVLYCQTSVGSAEHHENLLCKARARAPEALVVALRLMLDVARRNDDGWPLAGSIGPIWAPEVEEALLDAVRQPNIKPASYRDMLAALVEHGSAEGIECARTLVVSAAPRGEPDDTKPIDAALALMAHAPRCAWESVWPALREHSDFGRVIVVSRGAWNREVWGRFADAGGIYEVVDFIRWLAAEFGDDAPDITSDAWPALDAARKRLQEDGRADAATALDELAAELPGWRFEYTAHAARTAIRARAIRSLSPGDVLALCDSAARRLVHGDADLQRLVIEMLAGWEQPEPSVSFLPSASLWNDRPRSPHHEETARDEIMNWLQRKLCQTEVVVGGTLQITPEPQVSSSPGRGKAPTSDVGIHALCRGDRGEVHDSRLVMELKCPWHDDFCGDEPIRVGLVDRYLRKPDLVFGIYLVPWFLCDKWDGRDKRKAEARQRCGDDIEAFRARLEAEAAGLETDGWRVAPVVLDAVWR